MCLVKSNMWVADKHIHVLIINYMFKGRVICVITLKMHSKPNFLQVRFWKLKYWITVYQCYWVALDGLFLLSAVCSCVLLSDMHISGTKFCSQIFQTEKIHPEVTNWPKNTPSLAVCMHTQQQTHLGYESILWSTEKFKQTWLH